MTQKKNLIIMLLQQGFKKIVNGFIAVRKMDKLKFLITEQKIQFELTATKNLSIQQ